MRRRLVCALARCARTTARLRALLRRALVVRLRALGRGTGGPVRRRGRRARLAPRRTRHHALLVGARLVVVPLLDPRLALGSALPAPRVVEQRSLVIEPLQRGPALAADLARACGDREAPRALALAGLRTRLDLASLARDALALGRVAGAGRPARRRRRGQRARCECGAHGIK
jgi:hypothetical protein